MAAVLWATFSQTFSRRKKNDLKFIKDCSNTQLTISQHCLICYTRHAQLHCPYGWDTSVYFIPVKWTRGKLVNLSFNWLHRKSSHWRLSMRPVTKMSCKIPISMKYCMFVCTPMSSEISRTNQLIITKHVFCVPLQLTWTMFRLFNILEMLARDLFHALEDVLGEQSQETQDLIEDYVMASLCGLTLHSF